MAVHQLCLGQIPACWTSWKRRSKAAFEMKILLVAKYESQDHIEIWNLRSWLPLSRPATRTLRIWCSGENTVAVMLVVVRCRLSFQQFSVVYPFNLKRHSNTKVRWEGIELKCLFDAGYPSFPYILINVLIGRCSSMKKKWDYITQFQHC